MSTPFSAKGEPASGWQGGALDHYANSPFFSQKSESYTFRHPTLLTKR